MLLGNGTGVTERDSCQICHCERERGNRTLCRSALYSMRLLRCAAHTVRLAPRNDKDDLQ